MSSRISRRNVFGRFLAAVVALVAGKSQAALAAGRGRASRAPNAREADADINVTTYSYESEGN